MNGLTAEAMVVLQKIIKACAARPFGEAQAELLCPDALCRAELQLALLELREAGLLELRQKLWGERLYQIPEKHLPSLQRILFPRVPVQAVEVTAMDEEAGPELSGELFRALAFIAEEGLPLTAKGAIHKKNINRLAAGLTLPGEQLKGLFPAARQEVYPFPLPVMVILDLLLCLGLVRRGDSAFLLETRVLESWLQLSGKQMSSLLYGLVLSRYGQPDPAGQHFRYIVSSADYPSGMWFALRDILERMLGAGLVRDQGTAALEASARIWLAGLAAFGWCELGRTEDGSVCFRWTTARPQFPLYEAAAFSSRSLDIQEPSDETEESFDQENLPQQDEIRPASDSPGFIVQPDFEVLVPAECPYSHRWLLAGCAELQHSDDLWSYRLTREKLESAAEQGLSPETVISWLADHAQGGLPAQVELSLRQWSKGIGRTELAEVILLACRSEADGNDIAAHPRLSGLLARIGPQHFIVRMEDVESVRKELRAAGLAPPKRIAGQKAEPGSGWPFLNGSGMVDFSAYTLPVHGHETGLFAFAPVPPLIPLNLHASEEAVLSGLAAVPQMWIKQWRKYHATTAQKVMEQAVEWGVKVRLSMEGEVCEFIPARISRNPWEVQGTLLLARPDRVQEARLSAGDWQEMQLMIPKMRRNSSSA
ncbi:helicase-associated domain-containing protein [Paenibacillus graminis]|uniref:helicase-associated domain-containing protein n=1 Tax=Paenibacillus graminis TaxID=189425 RepID=UPI002DBA71E0|nr:helicase-associated domain-containing protein [Paenibacillus graminis]MEC0168791.1 helicase-associated domain-containing protein [Paenibacillus graminis]